MPNETQIAPKRIAGKYYSLKDQFASQIIITENPKNKNKNGKIETLKPCHDFQLKILEI